MALSVWGYLPATWAAEEHPSVEEIVARANQVSYYQGNDGRADVHMRIVDAQNRERTREFTILRRDDTAEGNTDASVDQRFYVYFKGPPDVRDTVFMVWKHVARNKDDDRWLYLPDLDLVKRIAASDERTSFVGSHFFYEDVSGRNTNEDEHKLVEVTDKYFVLENTPKNPDRVEFSRYKMWIHKETFLPIQTEYYDKRGEAYRRYKVLNVSKPQGFLTAVKSKMEDLKSGGYTVIEYSDVAYNVDLPKDIFTERYLRKPPMKYIQKQ
ncbi:MAG: outer membrane lipoprotein-sorting protein [Deltaproteobacteria bacterium]|nr:outer membrane lipoprotein-sorting protein [Deltaproteobacteria bacterium]